MEKFKLEPKENNLVNLSNSILKFFGCETFHDTIPEIDKVLKESGKKKVCVFLFDAFAKALIEKYKDECPYIYEHVFMQVHSVYPPTTVACTTSLLTGKYPIETGYLGWCQYIDKYKDFVEVFTNRLKDSSEIPVPVYEDVLAGKNIADYINEKQGKGSAILIRQPLFMKHKLPFKIDEDLSFIRWEKFINNFLKTGKFIYAYTNNPDNYMHELGTENKNVIRSIRRLNKYAKRIVNKNPDTIFIGLADHGMVDIKTVEIDKIPGFVETLKYDKASIEPRFATFFVKDKKGFEKIYKENEILNKNFYLYTRKEILDGFAFGKADKKNHHKCALDAIGDYFLISHSEYVIKDRYAKNFLRGQHAGVTPEEYIIDLQVYNK